MPYMQEMLEILNGDPKAVEMIAEVERSADQHGWTDEQRAKMRQYATAFAAATNDEAMEVLFRHAVETAKGMVADEPSDLATRSSTQLQRSHEQHHAARSR